MRASSQQPPPAGLPDPAADDWAALALQSLRDNRLAITPQNFAVWYEYHRGSAPELKRVVDILLSNRGGLTDDRLERLHERFLGGPQAYLALRSSSQRVLQTIEDVQAVIGGAGEEASRLGDAVRRVSGQFVAQDVSIADLIQSLLSEAQEMVHRTEQMEAELTRNAEMMKSLHRTLDDARREALTDGLTGLANRRHFDETLQALAGQAMNNGAALSLLLLDIDHFKRINDRWGHPVGDQVLQLAATVLRSDLREADVPARYGGEEFAVLLPATNSADALTIGERVRAAFARNRVVVRETREPIGPVTVSIGVGTYHPGEKLADWLRRTDAALYEGKQTGRNRVVLAVAPAG